MSVPRRSALYLPASNPRAIEKARTLACDVVILDLEDSVAPESKADARSAACEAVRAGGFGPREVVIRINGLETPWGRADLAAAAAAKPDAVLAPKVSSAAELETYAGALAGSCALWAMIETCEAVFALAELAQASRSRGCPVWVVGVNDLVKEMRCRLDESRSPLAVALTLSVMAARSQGLAILDGVYNHIADLPGLERECEQGAALGFDGKTLIHPSHLETANRCFAPRAEEVAWARTVAAAFEEPGAAGKGVLRVAGRMVERLHLAEARRILELSDAISAKAG